MRGWAALIENVFFFNLIKKLGAFIYLPTAWKSYINSEKILRQICVWAPVKRYLCLLLEVHRSCTDDGFVLCQFEVLYWIKKQGLKPLSKEAKTESLDKAESEREISGNSNEGLLQRADQEKKHGDAWMRCWLLKRLENKLFFLFPLLLCRLTVRRK